MATDFQPEAIEQAIISGDEEGLEKLLIPFRADPKNRQWYGGVGPYAFSERDIFADARFILLRAHFFESWPAFTQFMKAKNDPATHISKFETAADAIATGDVGTLSSLLRENPGLINMRSQRLHVATLLHYVGANGIEGFRQVTPKNANEILNILLKAGADVNATASMYGKDSTIGLVATSIHPLKAGVQLELMETLINHCAVIEDEPGTAITGCLANGRREAAEYFAARGAAINLEGASGIGRTDLVKNFFHDDGGLKDNATAGQMRRGLWWACEYGRTEAVKLLLQKRIDIDTQLEGFHWAAFGGYLDIVLLFLERKPPLELRNRWGSTVLGAAVYGAEGNGTNKDYRLVIKALLEAGANVDAEEDLKERVARIL